MDARYRKIILGFSIVLIVAFVAAIILFRSGQRRAVSAVSPEQAAGIISRNWNGAVVSPQSLQFQSARFSNGRTLIVYHLAESGGGAHKFTFEKEESSEPKLVQIILSKPFAQDSTIWTADEKKN